MPDPITYIQASFGTQLTALSTWVQSHPFWGWAAFLFLVALLILGWLGSALSSFDILRAKILKPFARQRAFSKLTRAAKKYDIRGHVNKAVAELQPQLPAGWIRKMDIEWVETENKEDFFHDNEVVVRVRPFDEQSRNFATVTYQFLKKSFFPKVKKVIPEVQREAAVLHVCERIMATRGKEATDAFVDYIFEPAIDKKSKVSAYHSRYKELDNRGLFTGLFLREIQHIAEEVRTTPLREKMGEELNESLTHLEEFSKQYKQGKQTKKPIDDYLWSRTGAVSKYALMLVARPEKALGSANQYTGRARSYFNQGVDRLYILGTATEKSFARSVIQSIEGNTDYVLEEQFELCRDYRGGEGGVGAIFVKVSK